MSWFSPRQIVICVKNALVDTVMHDGIEHAGYLAFLGLLALFPFLVFMIAVIGVVGQGEAGTQFITALLQEVPQSLTAALKPRVVEIVSGPPQGILTVAIIGAIWTASSAVEGVRTVLNRAYRVQAPPAYVLRRSLSVLQLLVFTFITISGMICAVGLQLVLHHIGDWLGVDIHSDNSVFIGRLVFFIAMTILFIGVSFIYYVIPNIQQRIISVVPGALIVVMCWLGAASLFTQYLSNFEQVNLIYGSLGSMIAALVFFYICNMIFIFGAELNYQIVHTLGLRIVQREGAPEEPATIQNPIK